MRIIVLATLFLVTIASAQDIRINCPWHGIQFVSQRNEICPKCKESAVQKKQANSNATVDARKARNAKGEFFESDLYYEGKITINTRSFGSTNVFAARCFSAITNRYVKVDGKVYERSTFRRTFKIRQHIGSCEYLADMMFGDKDIGYFKLETCSDNFVDNDTITIYCLVTDKTYEYTTVIGGSKRVRIVKMIPSHMIEELTVQDMIDHMNVGNSFEIRFAYDSKVPKSSYKGDGICHINATITMNGGSIVRLGK